MNESYTVLIVPATLIEKYQAYLDQVKARRSFLEQRHFDKLVTLKTTFWLENLIHRWTQNIFFPKSGQFFFLFFNLKKRQRNTHSPPLPTLVALLGQNASAMFVMVKIKIPRSTRNATSSVCTIFCEGVIINFLILFIASYATQAVSKAAVDQWLERLHRSFSFICVILINRKVPATTLRGSLVHNLWWTICILPHNEFLNIAV